MSDSDRRQALLLSGGRGRGADQAGVLRFLEKHDRRGPCPFMT